MNVAKLRNGLYFLNFVFLQYVIIKFVYFSAKRKYILVEVCLIIQQYHFILFSINLLFRHVMMIMLEVDVANYCATIPIVQENQELILMRLMIAQARIELKLVFSLNFLFVALFTLSFTSVM